MRTSYLFILTLGLTAACGSHPAPQKPAVDDSDEFITVGPGPTASSSSATSSSASASSSSASAGSGGGVTCGGITVKDPTCNVCFQGSCCAEGEACANDSV